MAGRGEGEEAQRWKITLQSWHRKKDAVPDLRAGASSTGSWTHKGLGRGGLRREDWGCCPTFCELLGSAPSRHLLPEVPSQTEVPERPGAAQTLQHGIQEALGSSRDTPLPPGPASRKPWKSFRARPPQAASSHPQHCFEGLTDREEGAVLTVFPRFRRPTCPEPRSSVW